MTTEDEIKYILATATPKNDNKAAAKKPEPTPQTTQIKIDKSVKIVGNHIHILSGGIGIAAVLLAGLIFFS